MWLRAHPGRVVTQFQIGQLFGKAFVKAASVETAINSFAKTGIWPLNANIFTDIDFVPSEVTEQDNPEHEERLDLEQCVNRDCQSPPPTVTPELPPAIVRQAPSSTLNSESSSENEETVEIILTH